MDIKLSSHHGRWKLIFLVEASWHWIGLQFFCWTEFLQKGRIRMKSMAIWLVAVVVVCLDLSTAHAEEQPVNIAMWKRFTLYGGAQFYAADGEFTNTVEGEDDISVDMGDLGLDETQATPVAGAIAHFWSRRLTLRFDYFGYHDDANATADFEFDWDGETIPVDAALDSNLDLDIYALNLSYNFIRSDRARLGAGLGIHLADVDIGVSGSVSGVVVASGDADVLAPLPNIYLTGAYAFTDNILTRASVGGFSLKYGDWDGRLFFVNAFLEYWPWEHVGIGAGYRYVDAHVEYDPGHKIEEYDFTLPGLMLYMAVGF